MAKGKYEEWLTEEGLTLLKGWARDGLTDEEIADKMGIGVRTLYEYKNRYPQISQSLKEGKEVSDYKVEGALYKSAIGYKIKEQKITSDGKIIEIEKEIPPNVTAIIFWLKNRRPDKWRDKTEQKITTDSVVIIDDCDQ